MCKVLAIAIASVSFFCLFASPVLAQWGPDVRLTFSPRPANLGQNPGRKIVASGDTLHVVWVDSRDGNDEIYYKRSTDGGTTWEPDNRLTNNPAISGLPAVAVSGSNVSVVFADTRDTLGSPSTELYYKRSTDGGTTWGPDTRLTEDDRYFSFYPSVGVLGSEVHVVWDDQRDGSDEIYYKRSTDGGTTWTTDTTLTNFPDPGCTGCPLVALSGSYVHVTWNVGWPEHDYGVYYKRSTDRGETWGPDTCLAPPPPDKWPSSLDASGLNVHLMWEAVVTEDPPDNDIYYMRSSDAGVTWGLDTCLIGGPFYSSGASVAVSASNVHVLWRDGRDGNDEIYYKRSMTEGSTWEPDTRLTFNPDVSKWPFCAVAGTKVHVVWDDMRDHLIQVYYKRDTTGNSGIEERAEAEGRNLVRLKAAPNPFASFAMISGHKQELFALYDISGRKVGTYRGERIGEGLSPGVYFLKPNDRDARPLRIVKVR